MATAVLSPSIPAMTLTLVSKRQLLPASMTNLVSKSLPTTRTIDPVESVSVHLEIVVHWFIGQPVK